MFRQSWLDHHAKRAPPVYVNNKLGAADENNHEMKVNAHYPISLNLSQHEQEHFKFESGTH